MTTEKYTSLLEQYGTAQAALTAIMDGHERNMDYWFKKRNSVEFNPDEFLHATDKYQYAKGATIATRNALELLKLENVSRETYDLNSIYPKEE